MDQLQKLVDQVSKLPTLGPRSARKIVLYLLKHRDVMQQLIGNLSVVQEIAQTCNKCGNIDIQNPCKICANPSREQHILCVVEDVGDIWAIERSCTHRGRYHVLGGTLSALHNITPEKLNLHNLGSRIDEEEVSEVIIAIGATLDGQTTAFYISDMLAARNVLITRLAFGLPVGAELEYMDDGTLNIAMKLRNKI